MEAHERHPEQVRALLDWEVACERLRMALAPPLGASTAGLLDFPQAIAIAHRALDVQEAFRKKPGSSASDSDTVRLGTKRITASATATATRSRTASSQFRMAPEPDGVPRTCNLPRLRLAHQAIAQGLPPKLFTPQSGMLARSEFRDHAPVLTVQSSGGSDAAG